MECGIDGISEFTAFVENCLLKMFIKSEIRFTLLTIFIFGLSLGHVLCEVDDNIIENEETEGAEKVLDDLVRVSTFSGVLEGRNRHTPRNVKYASFENIPYAIPPIGNLRFKDPIQLNNWEGILNATRKGNHCSQLSLFTFEFIGDEDCLVLNIYTPHLKPDKLLPVMVHYAGGGLLMSMEVMYSSPNHFIDEDILLVLVNYRLGPLGFLSLGTEEVPGNAGLKDQVTALRWIKKNIAAFGGNPDLVTAFGESAGGLSTSLLQISEMTKGLLHGVISISSASFNEWAMERNPKGRADELAKNLGLNPDSEDLLEDLRAQTSEEIIVNGGGFINKSGKMGFSWKVVKERQFDNVEAFITRWPKEHYEFGQFNHIPALIGYCSHEGAPFYGLLKGELNQTISENINPFQKWNLVEGSSLYNDISERVRQFYFKGREHDVSDRELLISVINMLSDVWFIRDIDACARSLAHHSKSSVYYYRFSYKGDDLGLPIMRELDLDGAAHADETFYLFGENAIGEESRDNLMRRRLFKFFKNFAITGNPTPDKDDPLLQTVWPAMTKSVANYMEINDNLTPGTDPDRERSEFWREIEILVQQANATITKEEL